MKIGAEKRLCL